MRPFPPFYFIFFHVTACGRAVHQQQEAAVLVLRKYHKAEIFTYIADTGALSSSQQLGLETRSRHTEILSLPSGIKVRKQNTSLKNQALERGAGRWLSVSCPRPFHRAPWAPTQLCHPPLEGGLCGPGGFYHCITLRTRCKVLGFQGEVINAVTFVLQLSISYGVIFLVISRSSNP